MQDVRADDLDESAVNPWIPVALGVLGAGLSALAAYAVIHRQRSGKIGTTEAETLWAEGQQMRQELRAEALTLRGEVLILRNEAVAALRESTAMRMELVTLRKESLVTHEAMTKLREECAALAAEIMNLRAQMAADLAGRESLGGKVADLGAKIDEGGTTT